MYNRLMAVAYAKKWAFNYNPVYYNFSNLGGDCTNFVSQCIYAGGISMNYDPGGWFYRSISQRAPAWTGVNEFWNFGISNLSDKGFKLIPCALNELEIGDIIELSNGARFYHNLIVTEVQRSSLSNKIFVSAHDNNAFNVPLTTYGFVAFRCAKVF